MRCVGRRAAGQVRCLQMALAEPQIFPMELYPMPNGQQRSAERGSDAGRPPPATREMPYAAGCRLLLALPDTAPRLCAGSRCRPQLLHGKTEALGTSEVQVLFANIKNLPACREGQNNAPFVPQLNLQNKAYVFSFPLLFIKGKKYP